ncbi:MAG: DUF5683 domain-containing protein [Flavobacteriales bacterium]
MKNLQTQFKRHCKTRSNIFFNKNVVVFILFFSITSVTSAQASKQNTVLSDTLKIELIKPHAPKKAALFSAIVPGLGQVYNKKYWKMPIIYTAIGTSIYFGVSNQRSFKQYKTAFTNRLDNDITTLDEFNGLLTDAGLEANIDFYQRNRDLAFIVAGIFYVLNIVDAAVDAHLFNFPKNDNLSFNLQPNLELTQNNQLSKGFKLVINL